LAHCFFILARLVTHDLILWGVLFTIFAVSFQIAFTSLAIQAGFDPTLMYPDGNGTFPISYLTILGEWSYLMDVMTATPIGVALLCIYAFIVQVMLVNLLIAMMGDTYATVRENSDVEWKSYRRAFARENMAVSPIPPPVGNLLLFLRWSYKKLTKISTEKKDVIAAKEKKSIARLERHEEIARREQVIAKVMRKTVDKIAEDAEKEEAESPLFQIKLTRKKVASEGKHGRKMEKNISNIRAHNMTAQDVVNRIENKLDKLEKIILDLASKADSKA